MAMCWSRKDGIAAIGSGGNYALSAARGLTEYEADAEVIARKAMAGRRRSLRLHQRMSP
jgi:ATP-dependent protease HslVU (ClpYQ) peptidase subunit